MSENPQRKFTAACLNLGFGASILLFGCRTPSLVVLISALRISGYDDVKKSIDKLYKTYERAKIAYKAAEPEIQEEIRQIIDLERELASLLQKFNNGQITVEKLTEERNRINRDLEALRKVTAKITLTCTQIVKSTDLTDLQEISQSVYRSMASVIAAHSLPNAEIFNHGISIGSKLAEILYVATTTFIKHEQLTANMDDQTLSAIFKFVGHASGLVISFMYRKLSNLITSCTIGAEMITTGLQDLVDPILEVNQLPILKNQPLTLTILQGVLFTIGFAQFRHHATFLERILFSPLQLADNLLTALMVVAKRER